MDGARAELRRVRRDGIGEGEVTARSRSVGDIVRYQSYTPGTDAEGHIDALSLWAGQSVGLVSEIKPAGDIIREIVSQAQSTLGKLMSPRSDLLGLCRGSDWAN
jgi:NAD(P)H-dependent flavin oxidoreductase YrpB (nitropropane dioxygenase family)